MLLEIVVWRDSESVRRGITSLVEDLGRSLISGEAFVNEHIETYEEVLPHVLLNELSNVVLDGRAAATRWNDMVAITGVFERALLGCDDPEWREDLENLLSVSWFEGIEVAPRVLGAFIALSGPRVLDQYRMYVRDCLEYEARVRATKRT